MIAKIFKRRSCIAIELGYSAVKGVRFRKGKSALIEACGIYSHSSVTEYPYEDPELVLPALISLRDKINARGKKIKLCINMAHVTVREIRVPVVPEDELPEVVKWELKKVIDFDPEEYNLDFKVLEKVENEVVPKFLVKVYVARKEILRQYVSLIEHADMEVELITIPPYALRALFLEIYGEEAGSVAILELGAKTSTLSVIKKNVVRFERQLMFSGFELKDILDKNGVEFSSLESLYTGYRVGDGGVLDKVTKEALNMLVSELSKSFGYYNSVIKGGKISRILLTGGLANIKGIDAYIADSLGMQVEFFNPLNSFMCNQSGVDFMRISVALGTGLLK